MRAYSTPSTRCRRCSLYGPIFVTILLMCLHASFVTIGATSSCLRHHNLMSLDRLGPSSKTGVTECSACGLCATCCNCASSCFGDLSRVALVVSGASGPCSSKVNGVFYATEELSGGQCVYIKRDNPDVCIHFWDASGQWVVAAVSDKGKNSNGWACVKHSGGLESASSLSTWKVTANGIFGDQPGVRVHFEDESERREVLTSSKGADSAFHRMLSSHTFCVGDRVQRGPDWKWKLQDNGGAGTVVEMLDSDGWVGVKWDHEASGK